MQWLKKCCKAFPFVRFWKKWVKYLEFFWNILFPALWIYLDIQGSEVSKENNVTDRSLWILIFFYGNQREDNNILYMQITAITYDARITFVHPSSQVSELGFGFPRMIIPITSWFLLLEIWYGWTALLFWGKTKASMNFLPTTTIIELHFLELPVTRSFLCAQSTAYWKFD